jgi:hypothetical protein
MLCTDGIYSFDRTPVGKAPDGSIWISGESAMALFYHCLGDYFATTPEPSETSLQAAMQAYLEALKSAGALHDDATLGLLVTPKAVEYQRKYWRRKAEQQSHGNV